MKISHPFRLPRATILALASLLPFLGLTAQVTNSRSLTDHASLALALAEAEPGDELTITQDLLERDVAIHQGIVIDGGGHRLTGAVYITQPDLTVTIRNLKFLKDNPANAILASADGTTLTIENCTIQGYDPHAGIALLGARNSLEVKDTLIEGCGSGIHSVGGGNQITLTDTTVQGNLVELHSSTSGDQWRVRGGKLDGGESGIVFDEPGSSSEISPETDVSASLAPPAATNSNPPASGDSALPAAAWPEPQLTAGKRLWDLEPTLWDLATETTVTQAIPPTDPQPVGKWLRGRAVNLSNLQMKVTLWGYPNRLTLSLGKTDVWDRRAVFEETITLDELRRGAFSPNNRGKVAMAVMREDGTRRTVPHWISRI